MLRYFIIILLLSSFAKADAQKIFRDFDVLKSPRVDDSIIGKRKLASGVYTGSGLPQKYVEWTNSYDSLGKEFMNEATLDVQANIQAYLNAKLKLSDSSFRVTVSKDIKIATCKDLSKISGDAALIEGAEYVFAVVKVGSFSFKRGGENELSVQLNPADESKLKEIFDGKVEFENINKRYVFKNGNDLIVGERILRVNSIKQYILGDPFFEIKENDNDSRSDADISPTSGTIAVSFEDYCDIPQTEIQSGGQGCIKINFSHSIFDKEGKTIVFCPECDDMSGKMPTCENYNFNPKYGMSKERLLFRGEQKGTIYEYSAIIKDIKIPYKFEPGALCNNYRVDNKKIKGTINLFRNIVKYTIL